MSIKQEKTNTFKSFMNRGRKDAVEELHLDAFEEPIKLRPVTQAMATKIQKEVVKLDTTTNRKGADFDAARYQALMACNSMIYPDLNNKELQDHYGVVSAESLYNNMFLAGEGQKISEKVMAISGFDVGHEERVEEAKN